MSSTDSIATRADFSSATENRLRVPPHSQEAEQAVLGGLLLDHQAFDQVLEVVQARDFYSPDHRLIFTAMGSLSEASKAIDIITVSEMLDSGGDLERIGGIAHLAELARHTPGTSNLLTYAQIVRERSTLRQLIRTASEVADQGYTPDGRSSNELLAEAEKLFADIAEQRPSETGLSPINPLLQGALQRIDELSQSDSHITGLSTGYFELDEKTSGWQKSDLVIVAARPSMGKTTFAMNAVEHALLHQEKSVVVFSLEMPAESIMLRLLSSVGRINQTHVRNGRLDQDEWDKLTIAVKKLKDRPLFIDDTPSLSPAEVRSRVRRLQREHGDIALIMIDYLQLMRVNGSSEGRTAEISEISRTLKGIAREFNCPVMALSQLNRSLENRPNKRPINSDLRESGAIEQDADVILFIYRDEVYNEDSADKGTAEIILGKQRNGPIGTCRLAFQGQYTRFDNLARSPNSGSDGY
jgi:replicative DNA helicase